MSKYNTTQLCPDKSFENHVFHRDQFAHYLRWSHVLKLARKIRPHGKILDVGCGSGNLLAAIYHNRLIQQRYLGIDIRKTQIDNLIKKYQQLKWASFETVDIANEFKLSPETWDIICCFEVIEHVGKENGEQLIKNIVNHMDENTTLLLSTPVYDNVVGAAKNHIVNGIIGEYGFNEIKTLLERYLIIDDVFGTFASKKDYVGKMTQVQLEHFNKIQNYYDSELTAVLFAPLFPENSRNCLWKLRKK